MQLTYLMFQALQVLRIIAWKKILQLMVHISLTVHLKQKLIVIFMIHILSFQQEQIL